MNMREGAQAVLATPVLFLIFNRPETTRLCFERIRAARPTRLYVVADGPREDVAGDTARCEAARAVIQDVDWPCVVRTDFRSVNLGLRRSIPAGIDWFFEQEEEGIILEDDCLAAPSFFSFAENLLQRYRHDARVMGLTGSNPVGLRGGSASYYFSNIAGIWGWATWRRAWKLFDLEMARLPQFVSGNHLNDIFADSVSRRFWLAKLQGAHSGWNTWGYAWVFTVMSNGGLCVRPNVNLISNIGFGPGGVHATKRADPLSNVPTGTLGTLVHPEFTVSDREADAALSRRVAELQLPEIFVLNRMRRKARRSLGRLKRAVIGRTAR